VSSIFISFSITNKLDSDELSTNFISDIIILFANDIIERKEINMESLENAQNDKIENREDSV
jgi:hypothetical protein